MGHIDPIKEVFAQFRANDRPGPIHMLNLVRLREQAAYPDGRKASGAEAYAAYGRESGPVFERLGGRIVWQGRFELMLIGPGRSLARNCAKTSLVGSIWPIAVSFFHSVTLLARAAAPPNPALTFP